MFIHIYLFVCVCTHTSIFSLVYLHAAQRRGKNEAAVVVSTRVLNVFVCDQHGWPCIYVAYMSALCACTYREYFANLNMDMVSWSCAFLTPSGYWI